MCLVRKFLDSGIAYYLELGNYLLARNLLLNGSFMQEAYYTPMSRIIASINDVGYTTQAYSLVPRFLTAIEAVAKLETIHCFLIHAIQETGPPQALRQK